MKLRDSIINTVIALCAVLFLLLICELFARFSMFIHNKHSLEAVLRNLPSLKSGSNVTLDHIIQPNIYPDIIYELRPNVDVLYYDSTGRTNMQGWRNDRDFNIHKDNNTIRIVGLGDSFMFGHGVDQNKNTMDCLEKELNSSFPEKKWEIINTAVPGYNTVMEVATLEKKALRYKPDIVIIEFIGNDLQLPNFIYDTDNLFDLHRFYFLDMLLKRYDIARQRFNLAYAAKSFNHGGFEDNPDKVPVLYKNMVGWGAYANAMLKLKHLQKNIVLMS